MLGIPRRYSHFVFGVIQSGLTSCIASAFASLPLWGTAQFLTNWILAWLISWAAMLPVVIFAAPTIRALSIALTRDDRNQGTHSL
jgi:polyferredoxin